MRVLAQEKPRLRCSRVARLHTIRGDTRQDTSSLLIDKFRMFKLSRKAFLSYLSLLFSLPRNLGAFQNARSHSGVAIAESTCSNQHFIWDVDTATTNSSLSLLDAGTCFSSHAIGFTLRSVCTRLGVVDSWEADRSSSCLSIGGGSVRKNRASS